MIELVIVVVIIGIIAAIAVPRMGSITDRARKRRVVADLATLQKAGELYTIEHAGDNLAEGSADGETLAARMIAPTREDGTQDADGRFGPYLRSMPENAINGLSTVRINGAAPGAGTHGWRYDTGTGAFAADTAFEIAMPDGSIADHTGGAKVFTLDAGNVSVSAGGGGVGGLLGGGKGVGTSLKDGD